MNSLTLISYAGFLMSITGIVFLNAMIRPPILKLTGLALFYLGGSILLLNVCSFQMCAALLVCGIGVTVLFGTADREHFIHPEPIEDARIMNIFRLILTVMIGILSYTITDLFQYWIPVRRTFLFVCVMAGLMGLISLSLDEDLIFRCMHLQSLCLAFTICYVIMENSVLVFSFFVAINLLMAFGGTVMVMGTVQKVESNTEEVS